MLFPYVRMQETTKNVEIFRARGHYSRDFFEGELLFVFATEFPLPKIQIIDFDAANVTIK